MVKCSRMEMIPSNNFNYIQNWSSKWKESQVVSFDGEEENMKIQSRVVERKIWWWITCTRCLLIGFETNFHFILYFLVFKTSFLLLNYLESFHAVWRTWLGAGCGKEPSMNSSLFFALSAVDIDLHHEL